MAAPPRRPCPREISDDRPSAPSFSSLLLAFFCVLSRARPPRRPRKLETHSFAADHGKGKPQLVRPVDQLINDDRGRSHPVQRKKLPPAESGWQNCAAGDLPYADILSDDKGAISPAGGTQCSSAISPCRSTRPSATTRRRSGRTARR